jgi:hypothetical protein
MKVQIEYTEKELKELVVKDLESKMNWDIDIKNLNILVKSKQNYRSEWEEASYKATYTKY